MLLPLNLLIVEDSPTDLDLLLRHLKKGGYDPRHHRVETETSMKAALDEGTWDTVLCDYNLPRFNALTALSLSKRKRPELPFIIVSGSVSEEDAVLAMKAGANDYVLKHNMTRLIPAIEREINEAKNRQAHAHIEAALKKKEEELLQAQKLEAVGQLAGGVAHDFNNFLAIILLQTDVILDKINQDPELRQQIQTIYGGLEQVKKAGERASNLTRQLLAFSRKQVIQPKIIKLNDIVRDMEKMLRRLVEESIDFRIELDPHLKNIRADVGHLEQIFMNLVVNSRDAMPKGGTLTIETKNSVVTEEMAQAFDTLPGEYVQLTVSDTGAGMSPETQGHLFEPFFTTKEIGKGTGLGLSTVYGIVRQNKGLIFIESAINQGTKAKLYFPPSDEQSFTRVQKMTSVPAKGHQTILVVEDEDALRSPTCSALKDHGYQVLQASNGVEAIEVLRNYRDPVHLAITDVVMPKMSGPDFAVAARKLHGETQFLYVSGYTESILVQQGINTEHVQFLEKPYNLKILLEKVAALVGTHSVSL